MRTTGSVASPMTSCTPSSMRSRSSTLPAPARSSALSAAPALTAFTAPPRRSPSPQSVSRRWRRARRPAVAKARRVMNGRGRAAWEAAWLLGRPVFLSRHAERAPEAAQQASEHRRPHSWRTSEHRRPHSGWTSEHQRPHSGRVITGRATPCDNRAEGGDHALNGAASTGCTEERECGD
jgi:hypothetical protein